MSRLEELEAFLNAVSRMREHQKGYFRNRSGEALRQAKNWERAVDKKLDELTGGGPTHGAFPLVAPEPCPARRCERCGHGA